MSYLGKRVLTILRAMSSLKERPGQRGQTGIMTVAGKVQRCAQGLFRTVRDTQEVICLTRDGDV